MFPKDNDDEFFFDVARKAESSSNESSDIKDISVENNVTEKPEVLASDSETRDVVFEIINKVPDKGKTVAVPEKEEFKSNTPALAPELLKDDDEIIFEVAAKTQVSVNIPTGSEKTENKKEVTENPTVKASKVDKDEIVFEINNKVPEKQESVPVYLNDGIKSKIPELPTKQVEYDEIFIKIDKAPEKERLIPLPAKKEIKSDAQSVRLSDSKVSPDIIYSNYNANKLKSADHKKINNVFSHSIEYPKAIPVTPKKLEEEARNIINPEHKHNVSAPSSAVCFPNYTVEKTEEKQPEIVNQKILVSVEASSGELNETMQASENVKSSFIKIAPKTFPGRMSLGKSGIIENSNSLHSSLSSKKSGLVYPAKLNPSPEKFNEKTSVSPVSAKADSVPEKEEKPVKPFENNIETPEFKASVNQAEEHGKYRIASLKGHISQDQQKRLETFFDNIILQGYQHVICDMSELVSMSSSGWGVMVAYLQRLKKHGGSLYLCSLNGIVNQSFRVLELDKLIPSFPSVKMAQERAILESGVGSDFQKNIGNVTSSVKSDNLALLSLEDKIKRIVIDNPDEGAGHICKMLKSREYGSTKIGIFAVQSKLRSMNLHTKEERRRFFRSA